jgi:hypothetical protein
MDPGKQQGKGTAKPYKATFMHPHSNLVALEFATSTGAGIGF